MFMCVFYVTKFICIWFYNTIMYRNNSLVKQLQQKYKQEELIFMVLTGTLIPRKIDYHSISFSYFYTLFSFYFITYFYHTAISITDSERQCSKNNHNLH